MIRQATDHQPTSCPECQTSVANVQGVESCPDCEWAER